jgi:hypothetical protein
MAMRLASPGVMRSEKLSCSAIQALHGRIVTQAGALMVAAELEVAATPIRVDCNKLAPAAKGAALPFLQDCDEDTIHLQ